MAEMGLIGLAPFIGIFYGLSTTYVQIPLRHMEHAKKVRAMTPWVALALATLYALFDPCFWAVQFSMWWWTVAAAVFVSGHRLSKGLRPTNASVILNALFIAFLAVFFVLVASLIIVETVV